MFGGMDVDIDVLWGDLEAEEDKKGNHCKFYVTHTCSNFELSKCNNLVPYGNI